MAIKSATKVFGKNKVLVELILTTNSNFGLIGINQ